MSDTTIAVTLIHPDEVPGQARAAIVGQLVPACNAMFARGVKRIRVTAEEEEDALSKAQRGYYWGVILKDTSEQARIEGVQYTPEAWHELGKRLHLPRRSTVTRVAGRRRPVVSTSLGTTQGLGIRRMGIYMEKFIAWVSTDFGVTVSEPLPPELRGQRKRARAVEQGMVDQESGEIMEVAA